jgi:hypothetical protein
VRPRGVVYATDALRVFRLAGAHAGGSSLMYTQYSTPPILSMSTKVERMTGTMSPCLEQYITVDHRVEAQNTHDPCGVDNGEHDRRRVQREVCPSAPQHMLLFGELQREVQYQSGRQGPDQLVEIEPRGCGLQACLPRGTGTPSRTNGCVRAGHVVGPPGFEPRTKWL